MIKRDLDKKVKYTPQLRTFALTLQFYSQKAYEYVRRVWRNLLPHPSTIRRWYRVVNGKPGFSDDAFAALKARSESMEGKLLVNIVLDEMSIKEQLEYTKNNGFIGGVNIGVDQECIKEHEDVIKANKVLVFMAVGINSAFKVPLSYF